MKKKKSKEAQIQLRTGKVVQSRGGGWYELPDGTKVRGRRAALQQTAAEALTGRFRFMRQAGIQYKGLRDIYTTAGYVQQGAETFDHFWSLYERNPIAGRIVDMPPKTTWRTPPEVFEGEAEKEENTEFERAWAELAKRLKVWRHFESVDRLSRVGRYAVLLIGARGGDDLSLRNPLEKLSGPDDVLYLSSFPEKYAKIKEWDQNPESVRFGFPERYEIELSSGVKEFKAKKALVHHSRLLHVAEDTLLDQVYGRPALKRALNALDDLLKVTASTGEAYWQLAARMLVAKIDSDAAVTDAVVKSMGEALEEMVHDLRRQFVGQAVDLKWLTGEVPKPGDALEVFKQMMAVASGIPTRILFGSEQGQLASSQDERTYFGAINERQEQHAEPDILRAFIDRMVDVNALPRPKAVEGYTVVWAPLFELSEKDIADANLTRANAAKALTVMGGDPIELVEIDGDRNVWLLPTEEIEKRRAERAEQEEIEAEDNELEELGPEEEELEEDEELADEQLEVIAEQKLMILAANQTQVQTLIFPKAHWDSAAAAKKWAKDHDFKAGSVDETSVSYRIRQRPPNKFRRMRAICLKGAKKAADPKCSIKAVVGPLK